MDNSVSMYNPDIFTESTHLQDVKFFDDVDVNFYASLIKESMYE
jgi:hypothetical protein